MMMPGMIGATGGMNDFNQSLVTMQEHMTRINSLSGTFASAMDGNFSDAAQSFGELRDPMLKFNTSILEAQKNFKDLGIDMEQVMTSAHTKAFLLVQRIEMLRSKALAMPAIVMSKVQEGIRIEADKISAASGVMRSEFAKSIPEAQRIISDVRAIVVKESAPLPGNTFTHLDVLSQTIDDSMKMAKDAGKGVEEAKAFSARVAGQIGAIGGSSGAEHHQTMRFASALMSGSLGPNAQMDLVERNPAMKDAMKKTLKEFGASSFSGIAKDKRMDAIQKMLDRAMPQTQLDAASQSLGGAIEGLQTSIQQLTSFDRTVTPFEGYEGPDITVFEEIKDILIDVIAPLNAFLEAIISNPITDPMTHLARVVNLLNGYFGNTARTLKDFEGMSFDEARQELGVIDFMKYVGANAGDILNSQINRERQFAGVDTTRINFGSDIFSKIINVFSQKFRVSVDSLFASINEFVKTGQFINSLDLGGSIGVVMAEIANNIMHLFNNLLPIIISQVSSMFLMFKKQIDLGVLVRFLQLFNGFQQMWTALQQKITDIYQEVPKTIETIKGGVMKVSGLFGILATGVAMLGGVMVFASTKITGVINQMAAFAAQALAPGSSIDNDMQERLRTTQEARERRRIFRMTEQERQDQGLTLPAGYDQSAYDNDRRNIGDFGISGFLGNFGSFNDQIGGFFGAMLPENIAATLLGGNRGGGRTNAIQNLGRQAIALQGPLMALGMTGMVPAPLMNMLQMSGLGLSITGNVASLLGFRGRTSEEREARNEQSGILHRQLFDAIGEGDFDAARTNINDIISGSYGPFGAVFNWIGKTFPMIGGILSKIPPAFIGAVLANIPLIMTALGFIGNIFKRAYEASPELQRAVGRFINGIKTLFNRLGRTFGPIYKQYVRPLFKILGDFLAKILNGFMNILNMITGNAFGEQQSMENTQEIATNTLETRETTEKETIKQAQLGDPGTFNFDNAFKGFVPDHAADVVGVAYKGYAPGEILTAASGFGNVNVGALARAATLESKMMPVNERLIMANSSETILTREQIESGRVMQNSRAIINVPKIDIMITSNGNQNPQEVANAVATVLMDRMTSLQNSA